HSDSPSCFRRGQGVVITSPQIFSNLSTTGRFDRSPARGFLLYNRSVPSPREGRGRPERPTCTMEVAREQFGDALNVIVKGRLDGYWADHLAKQLSEVLREGQHHVQLDLAGVNYMSSAGIGTLVDSYKKFKAIHGSFTVINPSPQVRKLLALTKVDA